MAHQSKKAVIAALFANFGIAIFKFVAAAFSGSSSMLAEGYHSLSDTLNQVLLLYGLRRSKKPPDSEHPFGHGKEQFFWSFVVAMILFGVAGTLSILKGWHKVLHPEPLSHLWLIYLAIVVGLCFDGYALWIAVKSIKQEMREEGHTTFIEAVRKSKNPKVLTVLFEDSLAMVGLLIVAAAVALVRLTGFAILDGLASILIGVLLMSFALFLAFETKELLLGEAVTRNKRRAIFSILKGFPEVHKVISCKTMHLGADEVLVALELDYDDGLTIAQLEELNDRIEVEVMKIIPEAKVYLEAENI